MVLPVHRPPLHSHSHWLSSSGACISKLLAVMALAMLHNKVYAQDTAPTPSAFATLPASRLAAEWQGPARVGQLQLRLIVLDAERGVVAAALTVGAPHCSGSLDSLGQWQKGTLVLKPYRPEPETDTCEVRMRVDARGRQAWVSETGCVAYHGAGCMFEGTLQAR